MNAFDKSLLSWNEIDHSIISAIGALQVARNCLDASDGTGSRKLRPIRSLNQPIQMGLDERSIGNEQVAFCFDEAERMLDDVRARITMARAILLGGPSLPAPAADKEKAAEPTDHFESSMAVRNGFSVRGPINAINIAVSSKKKFVEIGRIAAFQLQWLHPLRNFITRICRSAGSHLRKRIKWALRRSLRGSAAQARSIIKIGQWLLGSAAERTSQAALMAFGSKSFYVRRSSVVIGATLSMAAACAVSVWAMAAGMVGPSAMVHRTHIMDAAPDAVPAYSGCAISGWGKACYPRRAHQP